MIRELGIESNVTLAGFVPDYELCSHYNLCDLFAMPSKGEGFGIVFLEALACGKPMIAGNKDGSVEAVLNGELGALVDPDNVAEIANAIILKIESRKEKVIVSLTSDCFAQDDDPFLRRQGDGSTVGQRAIQTLRKGRQSGQVRYCGQRNR